MSRLLPAILGLLLASLLGLSSAFHVSDESSNVSRVVMPGLVLSTASVSEPAKDEMPVSVSAWFPHAHSECHGDHVNMPAKATISQMEPEDDQSMAGHQQIRAGVTAAPALRPPNL